MQNINDFEDRLDVLSRRIDQLIDDLNRLREDIHRCNMV